MWVSTSAEALGMSPEKFREQYRFMMLTENEDGAMPPLILNADVDLDATVAVTVAMPQFADQNPKVLRKRFPEEVRAKILAEFWAGVVNDKARMVVTMSGNDFREHLHFRDAATAHAHMEAITVLPELMRAGRLVVSHADKKPTQGSSLKQVHRFISALRVHRSDYSVMLTVKEFGDGSASFDMENPVRLYHHRVEKTLPSVTSVTLPIEQ